MSKNSTSAQSHTTSFDAGIGTPGIKKSTLAKTGFSVTIITLVGIVGSELTQSDVLSDAICATTCGAALTLIGSVLVGAILCGSWSVCNECFGSKNAGYELGCAATICVVLLVLGISGLAFGIPQLFSIFH